MKKEFNNTCFDLVREYISRNGGFGPEIDNFEAGKLYTKCMNEIKVFDGIKVELSFIQESDWRTIKNTKKGKIVVLKEIPYFFEGKRTRMGNQIDAGLLLGFRNMIVPIKIVEL